MLETMYVRCTHCGYDNSPEYRFCGMCGASLAHPPVAVTTPAKEAARLPKQDNGQVEPVHGPSFLGLADDAADPKVEFHYLYEDEQPKSHVGLIVFLFLALGAAGFAGWQWKHNGFPFNRMGAGEQQASASPSEVAPASNPDQQTHIDKPMTGAGEVLPTQPDQNAQNQTPGKPTETDIPPANGAAQQNAGSQPASTQPPNTTTQNAGTPAPGDNSTAKQNAAASKQNAEENTTEEANATPPPGVDKASRVAKEPAHAREPKPAPSHKAAALAPSGAPDADLELAGEKFLYGNGVPQNCTRAESSLRTAAMHGNSKAETVLGTMYATGHCVGRDLPSAYRWFARALHEEPQNSRISADLQVLWRQMTPQEKQLATNRGQ
ncbi:MAG TPA: zinc-ribbon domain-containing protein [Terriglobales bacterium]|nr:zinc-ribbon domain-containing protein [Terriglobales bacterium]